MVEAEERSRSLAPEPRLCTFEFPDRDLENQWLGSLSLAPLRWWQMPILSSVKRAAVGVLLEPLMVVLALIAWS